jgi:septum formation protein
MKRLNKKIVLGSGSPRRQLLLKEMEINFRVLLSNTNEIPLPHLTGSEIAVHLAEEKAVALKNQITDDEILVTADTIVWMNELFGKPADEKEAFGILKKLNGKVHFVYTGICILKGEFKLNFYSESKVFFQKLSDDDIRQYILLYKPLDKAGAYGAQECFPEGKNPCTEEEIIFMEKYGFENLFSNTQTRDSRKRIPIIDHIEGSYFNVMGLPVARLYEELVSI